MSESYQMQTIVQEDLLVYYTLIFWLSFAFQVHCSEKSQVSLDIKRLLSRILTFVFIIFPSPETFCTSSHGKDCCYEETAIAELSV